jgi:serine/threonine protein kinase
MGDASGRPEVSRDALIGKLALELRWVTPLQLREALAEQWADTEGGRGKSRSLGSILVSRGVLTEVQLEQIQEQLRNTVPSFPPYGKYNVIREVGRGPSGVVYEAEDTELRRRVALKMLVEPPAREAAELQPEHDRFLHESRAWVSLPPHPGVVPVLEADVIENRRYVASELVDGVAMGIWHRHGSVTVRQRVSMLRDIALALHHLHRHGLLHLGLKPENVLVDRNRQPRLTDYAVAGLLPPTEPSEYAAPDRAPDARSDVYSLGVLLYEILTGRLPGPTLVPPSRITTLKINPVVFRNLENICLIALAPQPHERYADAESFARDLTKWLKGEDMRLVVPRTWRLWRSRKTLKILSLVALATLVAAGAVFFLRSREKDPVLARPSIPIASLQPGAIVESYAGLNFNVLAVRKIDTRVAFDESAQLPWAAGPSLWTSQRWIGHLRIFASGTYTFELVAKEHTRLTIDGVDLMSGAGPKMVTAALKEGTHPFVLEHRHESPDDRVKLLWKKEGEPSTYPLGPVSVSHLKKDFQDVTPGPGRSKLPSVAGAEEGEHLPVIEHSGRPPSPHGYAMYGSLWKGTWSGDSHLWWARGVEVGDRLTVRFAAGESGRGTLALGLTRASDHGIFRLSVNGKVIAESLDLWSEELRTGEMEFKNVELKAGANDLEFKVVGSNPKALDWGPGSGLHKLGLDYVLVH